MAGTVKARGVVGENVGGKCSGSGGSGIVPVSVTGYSTGSGNPKV